MKKAQAYTYKESRERSLVKSIMYRVFIIISDIVIVYMLTKDIWTVTYFTIISNLVTSVEYYLHERLWAGIKWGINR